MAKKELIPQALEVNNEIIALVEEYMERYRIKRKFWNYDFFDEAGVPRQTFRKRGHCFNLNTACKLLDAIGYKLKVVKKEDIAIVKRMKAESCNADEE